VEAAHKAAGWARATAHQRAQVLYYLAENLAVRAEEFCRRLASLSGNAATAEREFALTIERVYTYAAWADKYDGAVHHNALPQRDLGHARAHRRARRCLPRQLSATRFRFDRAAAVAMGNTVVAVPSTSAPLAATDLYQVLDTSDVPGGVVNIVTGLGDELAQVLAAHDDVDGLWYFGNPEVSAEVERLSAGNMKRTWSTWAEAAIGPIRAPQGRSFSSRQLR